VLVTYLIAGNYFMSLRTLNLLLWLWSGFELGLTFESPRPVGVMGI